METEEQNGILEYSTPPPQPVGIYGWRKRCLYAFVLCLMIVVIINLALTVWILRVLHFSFDGMGKLKIIPKGFKVNGEAEFLQPVYVDQVRSESGKSLYLQSNKGVQLLSTNKRKKVSSKMVVEKESIEATCDTFHVQDSQGNTQLLLSDNKVKLGSRDAAFPGNIKFEGSVSTPSVRSPKNGTLKIQSETGKVYVTGLAGVSVTSDVGDVNIDAADNVYISSTDGAVYLNSPNIKVTGIPKADTSTSSSSSFNSLSSFPSSSLSSMSSSSQRVFQLCVCENGRAFLGLPSGDCRASTDICSP